ncbi:MAG TPA: protein-L-isoaspartate(D-aspartate) O-methyltransferase [Verrucomicrobiae bacterium]|nr:protein-L-isoaspartate(D-aspartate) O-methyltransferase [Verrucomicrobiae bacterium]
MRPDDFARRRGRMVDRLRAQGIPDGPILTAFGEVPRHLFVDEALSARAYGDEALPLGCGQTLSHPAIVARMIGRLGIEAGDRVLEVGTGSGYEAAILRRLGCEVFTVERLEPLLERARANWERAGIAGVNARAGDGSAGWPEEAPFAGIVVSAAAPRVPRTLLDQLPVGRRLVVPVGSAFQQKVRTLVRTEAGAEVEDGEDCRFVRLIGAHGFAE